MNRKDAVDALIKANCGWGEDSRDFLMTLEEADFTRINGHAVKALEAETSIADAEAARAELKALQDAQPKVVSDAVASAIKTNAGKAPKTLDEFLADAPPAFAAQVRAGIKANEDAKTQLITAIKSNKRNKFTDVQLQAKEVDELTTLAELAQVVVDFSPRGGGAPKVNADEGKIPSMPKINWAARGKAATSGATSVVETAAAK